MSNNVQQCQTSFILNCTDGVIVSMITLRVVDHALSPGGVKPKPINLVCFFSAKDTALRRKSKGWLAQNQDNMCKRSDMSTCRLLFQ